MIGSSNPGGKPIPAHVPEALVRPVDLPFGPEFIKDPFGFMAGLHRTHPPIFYNPGQGATPSWFLSKHEDCFHVLRHPDLFSSRGGSPFPRDPDDWFDLIPVEIEPPEHRKYRAILDPIFSPQGVLKLDANIRKLTNQLIDDFIDSGECELTEQFTRPLPVSVFLDLMGLPLEMRDTFVKWVSDTLHTQDQAVILRATHDISDYLKGAIAEKRANPGNDALTAIVNGRIDGEPLTFQQMFGFAFFVFIAGIDTVYATLNNIFLWLAQNPERRAEIAGDPGNIASVTEELLRVFTVTFAGRTVTQDLELRGTSLKAGDRVLCVLPTANFDPEIFSDPARVDFHRQRKPILAFAGGVHSCMGAHLARLEVRICIEEFLRRIGDFKVKDGAEISFLPGAVIGPRRLPLVW